MQISALSIDRIDYNEDLKKWSLIDERKRDQQLFEQKIAQGSYHLQRLGKRTTSVASSVQVSMFGAAKVT